jgi:hypothetical protein
MGIRWGLDGDYLKISGLLAPIRDIAFQRKDRNVILFGRLSHDCVVESDV